MWLKYYTWCGYIKSKPQLFLDLHLHSGMKSGLCPGCRCRPMHYCHSSCSPVTRYSQSLKPQPVISQTPSGHLQLEFFLKSQILTGYFSNSSSSFTTVVKVHLQKQGKWPCPKVHEYLYCSLAYVIKLMNLSFSYYLGEGSFQG